MLETLAAVLSCLLSRLQKQVPYSEQKELASDAQSLNGGQCVAQNSCLVNA